MPGFSKKPILLDGKGHMMGRLASNIAKMLLNGEDVIVTRCEKINISGNFYRNKLKYLSFLRKRCNVKPSRGPYHFRAPGKIFWRVVRGMLPHKGPRGKAALERLQCFEGVPTPYDKQKRMVIPNSLRVNRLKHGSRFCSVGRLAHEVGWKYQDIVETLEAKRKVKSEARYQIKMKIEDIKKEVMADPKVAQQIAPLQAVIESYGFK
jgi:large subunit ribosomal protein L13Ae